MSVINFFVECIPWIKEFVFDQILTEIINTTKNRLFNGHLKKLKKENLRLHILLLGLNIGKEMFHVMGIIF